MNYSTEEMREYMRGYRAKRLEDAKLKLGNRCARCGSTVDLEFDHVDPKSKVDCITTLLHASKAKFDAELAKCQLLCRSCHDPKTFKDQYSERKHGTPRMYRYCKCEECSRSWRVYCRERKKIREVGRAD